MSDFIVKQSGPISFIIPTMSFSRPCIETIFYVKERQNLQMKLYVVNCYIAWRQFNHCNLSINFSLLTGTDPPIAIGSPQSVVLGPDETRTFQFSGTGLLDPGILVLTSAIRADFTAPVAPPGDSTINIQKVYLTVSKA